MKDLGIIKGLVISFDTNDTRGSESYFGFAKMFMNYLNKFDVPFYYSCCPDASKNYAPVRLNTDTCVLEYLNKETGLWTDVNDCEVPTTTEIT